MDFFSNVIFSTQNKVNFECLRKKTYGSEQVSGTRCKISVSAMAPLASILTRTLDIMNCMSFQLHCSHSAVYVHSGWKGNFKFAKYGHIFGRLVWRSGRPCYLSINWRKFAFLFPIGYWKGIPHIYPCVQTRSTFIQLCTFLGSPPTAFAVLLTPLVRLLNINKG